MERKDYRYNVRDPKTHRFTKINWNKESKAMTIDNETHEQVEQNLPALSLQEDEMTIRSTLSKFADGIVKLSSFAKQIEDMQSKLDELNSRLGEATAARDAAIQDAAVARHDAQMARQAYDAAEQRRAEAVNALNKLNEDHAALQNDHGSLQAAHNDRGYELERVNTLLNIAREERDRFREAEGYERKLREDAEFKVLEFDDIKEKLRTTEEALDICARSTAEWKAKADESATTINALQQELNGLHGKCNGLEDDNKRQADVIHHLQNKVANLRHVLAE